MATKTQSDLPILVSTAEASRLMNLPIPKFIALLKAGEVVPDAKCGRGLLFNAAKIEKASR